jgi:hypothetical protein
LLSEKLCAEESRIDDGGIDAEGRHFGLQRLHPAFEAELRRRIGSHEIVAGDEASGRRDRDDVS